MFGIFGKKLPLEKLQKEHKKILEEAFKLSKINRSQSDALYEKASLLEKEIATLSVNK